jgi:hypothetical protein
MTGRSPAHPGIGVPAGLDRFVLPWAEPGIRWRIIYLSSACMVTARALEAAMESVERLYLVAEVGWPWTRRPDRGLRRRRHGLLRQLPARATVVEEHVLWPSARAPRCALPLQRTGSVRWTIRQGLLVAQRGSILRDGVMRRSMSALYPLLRPALLLVVEPT